jgi:hypothetical protein
VYKSGAAFTELRTIHNVFKVIASGGRIKPEDISRAGWTITPQLEMHEAAIGQR